MSDPREMAFVFDETKCIGCKSCVIACKDKNDLSAGRNLRFVDEEESGIFPDVRVRYVSHSCHNCEECVCVEGCPTGAFHRDDAYGCTMVDTEKCIGCGKCEESCSYGAPTVDPSLKKSQLCNKCVDLLALSKRPACVDACLARCLDFGELAEMQAAYPEAQRMAGECSSRTLVVPKDI